MNPDRDVARRGQVFTPAVIVDRMLALVRNRGRVLEPACGDGAFSARIPPHYPEVVAIELDPAHCPPGALNADFFTYPEAEQFDTIIGNPPYVKARDILPGTRRHFSSQLLDGHANLYLHFIEKCIRHLRPGGELIFITPRDFLKATGAARLNTWLADQGTITDFEDLGDAKIFAGVVPNCAIWRFEKGNLGRRTRDGRRMVCAGGQLLFTCHAMEVLNLVHKSQVMLVEKDADNESSTWRLDSVEGIRSDDNFYAKYMAGAYGAVPLL